MQSNAAVNDSLVVLAQDMYRFVSTVERPKCMDAAWFRSTRQRCRALSAQVGHAYDGLVDEYGPRASATLERMSHGLREYTRVLSEKPSVARMRQAARRLAEDYEDLVAVLRSQRASRAPATRVLRHIRPVTWSRGLFHVSWGLAAVLIYHFLLTQGQAVAIMLGFTGLAVTLESTRRIWPRWNAFLIEKVFGKVARPWERHRVNSATWYTLALLAITVLLPREAAEAGVLVLAFGDPAAALIGSRYGKVKLYRQKSIAGTSAFVVFAFAACVGFFALTGTLASVGVGTMLALCATAAVAGAIAELFADKLDDNFAVPVLAAEVAALWLTKI